MRQNILIVDNHPGIKLLLLEVFTHQGYNVTIADSGYEALSIMKDDLVDLVILDNNLPGLNGVGVIDKMMDLKLTMKVILISETAEGLLETTRDYPIVQAVIEKPFNITDLCAIVKEITNL